MRFSGIIGCAILLSVGLVDQATTFAEGHGGGGGALIVSAGTVFFKDLEHITTVVLMAWIYGTPIMYSLEMIPANIKWLFKVNPMTAVIESYHRILYWKELPLGKDVLYSAVFAIVMVIIGELVFAKLDDNFAEEL